MSKTSEVWDALVRNHMNRLQSRARIRKAKEDIAAGIRPRYPLHHKEFWNG